MFACTKYLKLDNLETPIGLIARLVLSNHMFVDQFALTVRDLKVSYNLKRFIFQFNKVDRGLMGLLSWAYALLLYVCRPVCSHRSWSRSEL